MDGGVNTAEYGEGCAVGDNHYRAWVGPPDYFDLIGAMQFRTLTLMGLREFHRLLDIGCGSLRSGRLFITYLRPGNYFGIDPVQWAVEDGLKAHFGADTVALKRPTFSFDPDFTLTTFGQTFDYLIAHSIFTHASQAQVRRCLQQAREVMSDRSIFLATFDESQTTDYDGDDWVYPGITEYTRSFMQRAVEEAGLKAHFPGLEHPWGQTWMAITSRDSSIDIPALASGDHFNPRHYLTVHKPEERNETIRSLGNG